MFRSMLDTPPVGTAKYITPQDFEALDNRSKMSYLPEYDTYRTKKVRGYNDCDYCGHSEYIGWIEESYPVGKPYRYSWHLQIFPDMVDDILSSNVLTNRMLNDNKDWDKR